jgi:hypothetical protein
MVASLPQLGNDSRLGAQSGVGAATVLARPSSTYPSRSSAALRERRHGD